MKMRKKKHLQRTSKLESDYFFHPATPEEVEQMQQVALQQAIERATKYLEATNGEFKRRLEIAQKWSDEHPELFQGVMCGKTKD